MAEMTVKELSAVEDILDKELILIKKYRFAASESGDRELSELFNHAADIHKKHFNMLIGYLKA